MRMPFCALLILLIAGCAEHRISRIAKAPPFYAPTTGTFQSQTDPYQVLPGSDADMIVMRGEKTAYGATMLGGYSEYTAYTSDAQAVGIRGSGYGYRYRWMVQSGISAP